MLHTFLSWVADVDDDGAAKDADVGDDIDVERQPCSYLGQLLLVIAGIATVLFVLATAVGFS